MLKLFKKLVLPVVETEVLDMESTIREIHDTFYTEVDRLLAEAKIERSLDTDKQYLLDKCERLKSLGFTNTKEVIEAKEEIERLNDVKKHNLKNKNLVDAINYFSIRYPHYKFITEASVKNICEKYNLIYGAIDRYIGTVPDKNLKHIEDFMVLSEDECYMQEVITTSRFDMEGSSSGRKYMNKESFINRRPNELLTSHYYMITGMRDREVSMKCPLEIAAPAKDFNMTDYEVKDFKLSKIVVPDPIVLKPVIFNKEKYYLIITAWGLEASDAMIFNENNN